MEKMNTESEKAESLRKIGLVNVGNVYWDLSTPALYEEAIRRYEAILSHLGPLVIRTGQYTGRLPKDKFLVREPSSENKIWWGKVNRPFNPARFDALKNRLCAYLQGKDIFIQNCYAGADACFRVPIRIFSQRASHGSGSQGTAGDIQPMFRRAVYGSAAKYLCALAR